MPKLHSLPKMHILLAHVIPFVRKHRFFGLVSEQSIEALHSTFNSDMEQHKTEPFKQQIKSVIETHYQRNALFDNRNLM